MLTWKIRAAPSYGKNVAELRRSQNYSQIENSAATEWREDFFEEKFN